MKRKIIKQGHNTLTITLPSKWAEKRNIKSGDEIDIDERENSLVISSQIRDKKRTTEFDITGLDVPTIWKYFIGVYRDGIDEVKIKFPPVKFGSPYKYFSQNKLDPKYGKEEKSKTPLEFFHDIVNRFIGFEVVEVGKDFVIIKDMSEPTAKEFETSLRRVFLLIDEMAEETQNAMINKDFESLSHIHSIDMNLDKFHDYCIRILNKLQIKDSRKSPPLFTLLFFLELTGDEFKNIAHHLIHYSKESNFQNILPTADSIRKQIKLFNELFFNFNKEKLSEISNLDEVIYTTIPKINKKSNSSDEKEIFHHFRIISRYMNALTELRIELEF